MPWDVPSEVRVDKSWLELVGIDRSWLESVRVRGFGGVGEELLELDQ